MAEILIISCPVDALVYRNRGVLDANLLLSRSFRHLKIHCLESLQEKGCKMGLVKIYSLEPLLEESQKYALLKWQKLRDNNKAISILLAENVMPTAGGAIANK